MENYGTLVVKVVLPIVTTHENQRPAKLVTLLQSQCELDEAEKLAKHWRELYSPMGLDLSISWVLIHKL